jgi:hypothetical protein
MYSLGLNLLNIITIIIKYKITSCRGENLGSTINTKTPTFLGFYDFKEDSLHWRKNAPC